MRVLHTADWHLGQRFLERDRHFEHKAFLDWLIDTLENERIDCLVVAGDIFDTTYPSHASQELYFQFLHRLRGTCCRHAVIVAGNHDSPGFLSAPASYMRLDGIHVIGHCNSSLNHVFALKGADGAPSPLMISALPFLREADLQLSFTPGQSPDDMRTNLREAIARHYQQAWAHCQQARHEGLALLATGHLFAAGAETTAADDRSERAIHIGNLGQVLTSDLDFGFDYIALGHIHRPQKLANQDHIRYCGSPIPLSFGEHDYDRQVCILDFQKGQLVQCDQTRVPTVRKLKRMKGSHEQILGLLQKEGNYEGLFHPWAEVTLTETAPLSAAQIDELHQAARHKNLEILKLSMPMLQAQRLSDLHYSTDRLDALQPRQVFESMCEQNNIDLQAEGELSIAFDRILESIAQA